MNRAYYAYIRVSTVRQAEQGSSLIEQKSAIEAYADRLGLTISRWFEERETAAAQGRRVFSQMIAALRAGKARGVIVHKIDRSARNLRDWSDIADLIDRGLDVRFVNDNFDLMSTGGRLSADIIAAVAASYVRNLREEVKKGLYGRLKQGLYPWKAPVGYLDQGGGKPKTIDPVKGPIVRQLFERYATNTVSMRTLRFEMVPSGLASRNGGPVSLAALNDVLRNPFYVGIIRLGSGQTYSGVHEPLIPKTLFERVQAILDGRSVPKTKSHDYLLRLMVRCGNCGRRTLTGETQKGTTYYRCHGDDCRGVSWTERKLEEAALSQIRRARLGEEDLRDFGDLVLDACRSRGNDADRRRAALNLRLGLIGDRLSRLTDLLIDGAIDQAAHNARREKLLIDRHAALDDLTRVDQGSPFERLCQEFELTNRDILRYEMLAAAEKRRLFQIMGSNFSADRKSPTFTLRTPYKEIAELDEPSECGHYRDNVRTERIVHILRHVTDSSLGDSPDQVP